jgi:hypothetical protein
MGTPEHGFTRFEHWGATSARMHRPELVAQIGLYQPALSTWFCWCAIANDIRAQQTFGCKALEFSHGLGHLPTHTPQQKRRRGPFRLLAKLM